MQNSSVSTIGALLVTQPGYQVNKPYEINGHAESRSGALDLVVVDSVAALVPRADN